MKKAFEWIIGITIFVIIIWLYNVITGPVIVHPQIGDKYVDEQNADTTEIIGKGKCEYLVTRAAEEVGVKETTFVDTALVFSNPIGECVAYPINAGNPTGRTVFLIYVSDIDSFRVNFRRRGN